MQIVNGKHDVCQPASPHVASSSPGFTLIEMSIVLVIIGLIVGGVLVGQDLIRAAGERATVSQVEKFNSASNTFLSKYGALPGDLNSTMATAFGFTPRGAYPGEGDANGVLKGIGSNPSSNACGFCVVGGETAMFWSDLTWANGLKVNMIEGNFTAASPVNNPGGAVTGGAIDSYFPAAKIGNGNYFYVWSGGPLEAWNGGTLSDPTNDGRNYFGLSAVSQIGGSSGPVWQMLSTPGLTVLQASDIDKKMDDGLPQSGNVISMYISYFGSPYPPVWSQTGYVTGAASTSATTGSATTCYDNGGSGGTPQHYSVEISGGSNVACALSFRFQ